MIATSALGSLADLLESAECARRAPAPQLLRCDERRSHSIARGGPISVSSRTVASASLSPRRGVRVLPSEFRDFCQAMIPTLNQQVDIASVATGGMSIML
jgi:hypothetical protein